MKLSELGPIIESNLVGVTLPVAASQKFHPNGASFVFLNTSGHITLNITATQYVFGWACPPRSLDGTDLVNGYWTSSSVAGTDKLLVYPAVLNLGVIFRVPCTAAAAVAARVGECADLVGVNDGTIQYVTPGTHTQDILLVVGIPEDEDTSSILVTFNPRELQGLT
jgi:hypothetical protein